MTLLVDVGNSAVKWAVLAPDGGFSASGRLLHRDGADVAAGLAIAWKDAAGPGRVIGCSVASPDVMSAIERCALALGLSRVEWLRSQPAFAGAVSLTNGYADPGQLGADRWHALLGAHVMMPRRSLVVANAGTATTVDCIRVSPDEARFVGGCIAPGVRLMLESLVAGTAGLPLANGAPADFPDTTDKAIVTGVLDAQAGLIERVWKRFADSIGATPALILAGGHAELLAARLPPGFAPVIEHNVVLRGLALRAAS